MADPKPRRTIRRFDVFAEYRKQEEQERGLPEDEAKGHGLWVAKLVAARAFGRGASRSSDAGVTGDGEKKPLRDGKWHLLGDVVQDDRRFDSEIVRRMGQDFYDEVFVPAIREARAAGKSYEAIRDAIRREWKPEPVRAAKTAAKARTRAPEKRAA
ncbi:MAG TPA: hypothetical protein VFN74_08130 [Chloroflexota bacterium]|nr:hypothetical protein [Chloroflexota bacterium]